MKQRGRPRPPHPELVRTPPRSFGWLDVRLLKEGWLAQAGPHATAALTFLALVADRNGASYWSRTRMAQALGMRLPDLDQALDQLRKLGLVTLRPWKPHDHDGVWQLLPLPPALPRCRSSDSLGDILHRLKDRHSPPGQR